MGRFKKVLPEGCLRARIRATKRETLHPKEGCLGDTLGDESHGMVIVDAGFEVIEWVCELLSNYCLSSCSADRGMMLCQAAIP